MNSLRVLVVVSVAFSLFITTATFAATPSIPPSAIQSTSSAQKYALPAAFIQTKSNPNPSPDLSKLPIVVTNPGYAGAKSGTSSVSQAIPDADSCFAYYKFGSVTTTIQSQTPVTSAGVPLSLSAVILNTNDYPIVDGALYIKIFKKRADGQALNGPIVVDQFFATDSIALDAHASTTVNFIYNIPAYAQTGDYEVATFFTTSKKFNLSGLSFTDDILGSVWDFSVKGGQPSVVEFDKDKVTVAGAPYFFASYPPTEPQDKPILVSVPVVNSTGAGEIVPVQWTVYSWDSQLASNIVATSSVQEVLVAPHASTTVSFIVPQNADPVYLVVGKVTYRDTTSYIDVRFVRQDVNEARLNFPSITAFPLKAGVPVTLFSCLYNSGLANVIPPHTIDLSLTGPSGNIIEQFSEKLPVTGAMMLVKKLFTPKATYDDFTLKATLTDVSGKVVDQVSIHYDCAAINPSLCSKMQPLSKMIIWASVILLLAIAGIGLYVYQRKYRKKAFKKKK